MQTSSLAAHDLAAEVNAYVQAHPGCSRRDLTQRFGQTARHLISLLDEDNRNLVIDSRSVAARHTDEDMISSLRQVAQEVGRPMSRKTYNAHLSEGMPAGESIMVRFGSWAAACERAGVQPGATPRRSYGRTWNNAEILDWINRYLAQESQAASLARYEEWVRQNEGAPAGSTIRVRFGRWSTAYAEALKLRSESSAG